MLFEDWPSSGLVGIARMAAESDLLEAKRSVEYFELPARRYIGRCSGVRMPFEWTINPYRGCEFGCRYCYARYTHEFMELRDPLLFERKIYAKEWNAAEFGAELDKIPIGDTIALGTATDPYQPAERRFGITRAMLEVFASRRGFRLWITTKSDLVTRDLDLLKQSARGNIVGVNVSITTLDTKLARLLEPMATRPDLRLAAIQKLSAAGIRTGVLCCPILPLLNDSEENLNAVAAAAARAGAKHFGGNVLFLKPCAQAVFFPFLEQHFPRLVRRYRERYGEGAFLQGPYVHAVQERVNLVRDRNGLNGRRTVDELPEFWPPEQMGLFEAG
ncbi:MAG TPA: radical SAM protein [Bryobacteraceae bacterium]|nr:radical SAM protein [Bryobacteraceae bacterium]